jgi:PncC family amidohydrolase
MKYGVKIHVRSSFNYNEGTWVVPEEKQMEDVLVSGVAVDKNEAKVTLLGVDPGLIAACGAVSDAVARAMAAGARDVLGADYAIAITGVAGPDGGSPDKPTGTVWFGIAGPGTVEAQLRRFPGDRADVRTRAVATALDLLRRHLPSD